MGARWANSICGRRELRKLMAPASISVLLLLLLVVLSSNLTKSISCQPQQETTTTTATTKSAASNLIKTQDLKPSPGALSERRHPPERQVHADGHHRTANNEAKRQEQRQLQGTHPNDSTGGHTKMIYGAAAAAEAAQASSGRALIDLDYNINHRIGGGGKKMAASVEVGGRAQSDSWQTSTGRRRRRAAGLQSSAPDRSAAAAAAAGSPNSEADEEVELEVRETTRTVNNIADMISPNDTAPATTTTTSPVVETTTTWTTTTTSTATSEEPLKCRLEKDLYLDLEEYEHYTCASCYNQFPRDSFKRKLLYSKEARLWLYDSQANRTLLPNETDAIRRTFQDEAAYDKWRACCRTAVECCRTNARQVSRQTNPSGQLVDEWPRTDCPGTWDGLACWPSSPGGQLAWRDCPRHVYFLSFEPACTGHVSKQCFSNGSWFIKNNHEWSDYSHCVPMAIYVRRMLFSVTWHIISVMVITPALLTINKFPGRGGNKRVKILRNLLFWLLISSCIQAAKNSGIVSGLFEAGRTKTSGPGSGSGGGDDNLIKSSGQSLATPTLSSSNQNSSPPTTGGLERRVRWLAGEADIRPEVINKLEQQTDSLAPPTTTTTKTAKDNSIKVIQQQQQQQRSRETGHAINETTTTTTTTYFNDSSHQYSSRNTSNANDDRFGNDQTSGKESLITSSASGGGRRCKRDSSSSSSSSSTNNRQTTDGRRPRSSALVIFLCWSLVVAERIARLMGYSWMFTGAIYLCSALHFAPAEPPAQAIRWLMFLTNAFPIVIALIYVTSRTIIEPSPLNIIFQVPYYKLLGDDQSVERLWSTQLDCWLNQPKHERIEDIADLPNLILVCLNVILFIITLIILCRINRPGSTRADMSPLTYFKAAGTLVVLYGGHYALLAYRPNAESCYYDIIMAYAFLFVDGIQGIAVSYVFCYRTQEGKEIIWKYWRNKHEHIPLKWCKWLYCRNMHKLNVDLAAPSKSRSNHHSTRSNNSTCNGHETVTELINIHDTPVATNNKF